MEQGIFLPFLGDFQVYDVKRCVDLLLAAEVELELEWISSKKCIKDGWFEGKLHSAQDDASVLLCHF